GCSPIESEMGFRISWRYHNQRSTNRRGWPCVRRKPQRNGLFTECSDRLCSLVLSSGVGGSRCSERRAGPNRLGPALCCVHQRSGSERLRGRRRNRQTDLENESR